MQFDELSAFIEREMRMSHIYQPLLIRALVDAGGTATVRQLAQAFLAQDESQLRYHVGEAGLVPGAVHTGIRLRVGIDAAAAGAASGAVVGMFDAQDITGVAKDAISGFIGGEATIAGTLSGSGVAAPPKPSEQKGASAPAAPPLAEDTQP